MKKSKKYGINAGVVAGFVALVADAIKQQEEIANNTVQKFDWIRLMKAAFKGAAVGGAIGFTLGSVVDYKNSKEKPLDTDAYLNDLADKIRLDKTSPRFRTLDSKAELLIDLLRQEFGSKLVSKPVRLGSTERETALNDKFDIDISLKFKSASFKSTEAMYFSVLDFLEQQIGKHSITAVRDQKKSIGVLFNINGQEERIDVVPFKSTRGKRTSGYLFVNEQGILSNNYSFTKTDINVLNRVKLSDTQKKIVIILKDWKNRNDLPLKSHLVERLVSGAYRCNLSIPRGLTKKVIMVLNHIANNLDRSIIRGLENTNNILSDIPEEDKDRIIQACRQAIDDYNYQPNDILNTF